MPRFVAGEYLTAAATNVDATSTLLPIKGSVRFKHRSD
tara:strand:- start:132 stop:245 length:114 start_codon:yes stop_codon:yes gene_type:complete